MSNMDDLVALAMFGVIYTGLTKHQKRKVKQHIRRHKSAKRRGKL